MLLMEGKIRMAVQMRTTGTGGTQLKLFLYNNGSRGYIILLFVETIVRK